MNTRIITVSLLVGALAFAQQPSQPESLAAPNARAAQAQTPPSPPPVVIYVAPAGEYIGNLQRIDVSLCSNGNTVAIISTDWMRMLKEQGVQMALAGAVQEAANAEDRKSWQRILALGAEVGSYLYSAYTLIDASSKGPNEEQVPKWKAAVPLVGGSIRMVTTAYPQKKFTMPTNAYPRVVLVTVNECSEFVVYGNMILPALATQPARGRR